MTASLKRLRKIFTTELQATATESTDLAQYEFDPCSYAEHVLGVILTPDQKTILEHLLISPCKVLVPSAHDVGKSFVAAVACNWWIDCRGPSVVITTAPTERDVVDILWTEIRLQRSRAKLPLANYFIGPRAPEMHIAEDWYAKGFTARRGESFQGRHRRRMLFIFDEANGVDPVYWHALRTMFDPDLEHAALAIFNPTSTTSQAYIEDQLVDEDSDNPPWHRFRLSALNHPNITEELAGRPKKIPGAVSLRMVQEWLRDWTEKVDDPEDIRTTDVWFPPLGTEGWESKLYRPGPIFQARALGLWPDQGDGLWSDALWNACADLEPFFPTDAELPQIGCDTAQGKGDDYHAIHGRWGATSIHHETANTMDPIRITARLRESAKLLADFVNKRRDKNAKAIDAKQIHIKIDDDGTGNAVFALLSREGYKISAVGAGCSASKPKLYPRKRDELWFSVLDRAQYSGICLAMLDKATKRRLKQQLLAPAWDQDRQGRRMVEPKDETKEKIGRSPDDADAFNLAYLEVGSSAPVMVDTPDREDKGGHFAKGRGVPWA